MSEKWIKTGIKLDLGESVRQRLSLRLKTNLSELLTLKNFKGNAFWAALVPCRLLSPRFAVATISVQTHFKCFPCCNF
eukprot:508550-Rhodomonas_salina.3